VKRPQRRPPPKAKPKPKAASAKKAAPRPAKPKTPQARPPPPKSHATPKPAAAPKERELELAVPLPGGRRHVLSLSFVRDGDEFLARLETDGGHITELKNRSLDQLLTLVAGELEDLLA
jgi:hypothetical protein